MDYYGKAYIDNTGKIWRNIERAKLINQELTRRMPFINRYGSTFGKMGGVLNAVDMSSSFYTAYNAESAEGAIYYTVEGILKAPAFIPGPIGVVYSISSDPVIRPIWIAGSENYKENLGRGMDPAMIFYIGGLSPGFTINPNVFK
jgi:hypothetical protein